MVATRQGLAILTWQNWTLAQKAEHYIDIALQRHNRHGLSEECRMPVFGQLSTCKSGPSDNSGLWTSLLVTAFAQAYALEPTTKHADLLATYQSGMELLVNVTNIGGLMARTCTAPGETHTPDEHWRNSSATGLSGWQFKCDASSDEVVGHMFAHTVVAAVNNGTSYATRSLKYLESIVTYIVKNGFYLIDVTGKMTRWGIWSPEYVNGK